MRLVMLLLFIVAACVQLSEESTLLEEDDGWDVLAIGLEQATIREGAVIFQAMRIDPQYYDFRAHYRPGEALTIEEWSGELPDAEVIINASFFTPEHTILGLLISDFATYGVPYTDRGGTFYVAGDAVGIRSNITDPYRGENFSQAIQAFPMLVVNGQPAYNNSQDTAISRRTIIAQDTDGHILLMVTSGFGMSLYQLSQYLAESDLNIVNALNLDGGGSTMMSIASSDTTIVSLDPVPAVLAVYGR